MCIIGLSIQCNVLSGHCPKWPYGQTATVELTDIIKNFCLTVVTVNIIVKYLSYNGTVQLIVMNSTQVLKLCCDDWQLSIVCYLSRTQEWTSTEWCRSKDVWHYASIIVSCTAQPYWSSYVAIFMQIQHVFAVMVILQKLKYFKTRDVCPSAKTEHLVTLIRQALYQATWSVWISTANIHRFHF